MPKSSTKKNSKPITHINSKKIPCRSNVQEIFFCAQRVSPFVHLCIDVVIPSVNHTLGLAYAGKGDYLLLTTAISLFSAVNRYVSANLTDAVRHVLEASLGDEGHPDLALKDQGAGKMFTLTEYQFLYHCGS